jgi:hypothetical protein
MEDDRELSHSALYIPGEDRMSRQKSEISEKGLDKNIRAE